MQTTGVMSASNWSLILSANSFDTWSPCLTTGQILIIPDGLITNSVQVKELNIYPPVNNLTNEILTQISNLINIFDNILGRDFEDDYVYNFEDNPPYNFEN